MDKVIDLINTCRFDIFFVAESKIDGSVNSSLFAHSGYCFIRRDRKKSGGGMLVAVFAAKKMYTKHKEVMFLRDFNIDMLMENESCVESICSLEFLRPILTD